ncbi:Hypothetical protein FKW44_021699, partial [Caligus rogercresseyi]
GSVLGPLLFIILTVNLSDYLRAAVNPTPTILLSSSRLHPGNRSTSRWVRHRRPWRRIQISMDSTKTWKNPTLHLGAPDTPSIATLNLLGVTVGRTLT